MRNDMMDLIVLRARTGRSKSVNKGNRGSDWRRDPEDARTRENKRSRFGMRHDRRDVSLYIAPLDRFLAKNVGRNWDEVYSEICSKADIRTKLGRNLREWVLRRVAVDMDYPFADIYTYFVDESGILREGDSSRFRYTPRERPVTVLPYDNNHECHLIDGIWRLVTLSKVEDIKTAPVTDVVTNRLVCTHHVEYERPNTRNLIRDEVNAEIMRDLFTATGDRDVHFGTRAIYTVRKIPANALHPDKGLYASSMKIMNKKELKRAGLRGWKPETQEKVDTTVKPRTQPVQVTHNKNVRNDPTPRASDSWKKSSSTFMPVF